LNVRNTNKLFGAVAGETIGVKRCRETIGVKFLILILISANLVYHELLWVKKIYNHHEGCPIIHEQSNHHPAIS